MKTIEILQQLVAFETVSSESNIELINFIRDFLTQRGFDIVELPNSDGTKAGLFASLGPNEGGVLLSGHTDVVPVEGQIWTKDPFKLTEEDGLLYGRGTTDMKGFVAAALCLADQASKVELKEPLKLAFSYDEEVCCVGIKEMLPELKDLLGTPRFCIVGEPSEMKVVTGHKGKAAIRATFHGQSGHSALAPLFVNALHMAQDFALGLRKLQEEYKHSGAQDPDYEVPYSTIHMGMLQGGLALNIVPDLATLDFEYRHIFEDDPNKIFAKIEEIAKDIEGKYKEQYEGACIEIDRYNEYPGLNTDVQSEVVKKVQFLAQSNSISKVAFGTEAGYFDGLGIPTVVCGPGSMSAQGHKPDENISISQLAACDAMLQRLLLQLSNSK